MKAESVREAVRGRATFFLRTGLNQTNEQMWIPGRGEQTMRRIESVGLILVLVLLGSAVVQAQDDILPRGEPQVRVVSPRAPAPVPVTAAAPALTTTAAAGVQTAAVPGSISQSEMTVIELEAFDEAFRVVVHVLKLTEDQALGLKHLLQMRREAVAPLLQAIAQREMQIQQLLQSGGTAAEIGQLVIEIHQLKQLVQQAQESFMAAFFDLLNDEQEQRFHQIVIAERLQSVLPAFKALHLL